jgi:hypothetical protein
VAPIHRKRTMCRSVERVEEQAQFKSQDKILQWSCIQQRAKTALYTPYLFYPRIYCKMQ